MVENDKIVYGGDLMIFVNDEPLAFSTSASINVNADTLETASKDSGDWKDFRISKKSWDGSSDGLTSYDLTGSTHGIDDVYALYEAGEAIDFAFAVRTSTSPNWTIDSSFKAFTGKALITSMPITAADGDNATYSITFQGTGALTLS